MPRARLASFLIVAVMAISLPLANVAAAATPPRLVAGASAGCYARFPVNVVAVVVPGGSAGQITTATATVHWTTGDQAYAMTAASFPFGNVAFGAATVPLGQPAGFVSIGVQVFVGAVELDRTVSSRIVCGSTGGVG
jgi:hypothetical protein